MLDRKFVKLIVLLLFFLLFMCGNAISQQKTSVNEKKNSKIEELFMKGLNYYIQRDFKRASESWEKVLNLEPTHSRAKIYFEKAFKKYQNMEINFYQGLHKFSDEKFREAIPFFKKTLFINPRHKKALYYLKMCYKLLEINLQIVKKIKKNAEQINDVNLTTDSELILCALGYDGLNNYLGAIKVNWKQTGTLDEINEKDKKSQIKFAPSTFDTEGTIIAYLDEDIQAETGKIKVSMGRLHHIKIVNAPNDEGDEVTKLSITSDQTKKLYAAGYDKSDIYIGDVPVDWQTSGTLEKKTENNTSVLNFNSRKIGKGEITAIAKNKSKAIIKDVQVKPGQVAYIQIEDAPDGKGKEVYSLEMTTDDQKSFFSIGYDKNDNLIGSVVANWKTTGTLEQYNTYDSKEFVFKPRTPDVTGTIKAERDKTIGDETGLIKIKPGLAERIYIVIDPSTNAQKLARMDLKAGEKVRVYSFGFDDENKPIALYNVNWIIDSDTIVSRNSRSLFYTNAGQKARIDLFHPKIKAQSNFVVTVVPNEPDRFYISQFSDKLSDDKINVSADEQKRFYAFTTDRYGNFINNVKCHWQLQDLTGSLSQEEGSSVDFIPDKVGQGRLLGTYSLKKQTGDIDIVSDLLINVVPGKISQIAIFYENRNISSNIELLVRDNQFFKSYALDKNNNIIDNIPVKWIITDTTGKKVVDEVDSAKQYKADPSVTNGTITITHNQLNKKIRYRFQSGKIAKLALLDLIGDRIISEVSLKHNEKIKLKAVGLDDENKIIRAVAVNWSLPKREENLEYQHGTTNILSGKNGPFKGDLILKNDALQLITHVSILPPELVTKHFTKDLESKNIILYYVYNGDSLSKIITRTFKSSFQWKRLYRYVDAIGDYNKIRNLDLIFPKQKINIPCYRVKKSTTKTELAKELFNDSKKKDLIIIYKKQGEAIEPDDRIIILNESFLRSGHMKVDITEKVIKK